MLNIRLKLQLWTVVGLALALPSLTPESRAQDRITAVIDSNGKVVFTNLASYNAQPRPVRNPPVATPGTGAPSPLNSLIGGISARHGVDPALVESVIEVESNFDRRAVSPKGAMGLMQLIRATGERFGVRDFFDPVQNIDGGVRYLRFLLEMFEGNLDLSLAAYNSGENRVARLGRIPSIPETQDYVQKVKSAYSRRGGPTATLRPAAYVRSTARTGIEAPLNQPGATDAPAPPSRTIVSRVDERGVLRFSNVD